MTWTRTPAARATLALAAIMTLLVLMAAILSHKAFAIGLPVRLAVTLPAVLVALWFVHNYWRSIDEAAREAQKWAWFWGGSTGLGVGAIAIMVKPLGLANLVPPDAAPTQILLLGGTVVMAAQAVCFLVAWAIWWLARR